MKEKQKILKKIIDKLYVNELLGINLYESLDLYPNIKVEVDKLIELVTNNLLNLDDEQTYIYVDEQVILIDKLCRELDNYYPSDLLFFNDEYTGLI